MLSYRHGFHAGNHADVLKHYTFCLVLDYFSQKDKPYTVIDTHAGAGIYQLDSVFAQKNKEFESGIARLIDATPLSSSLNRYIAVIRSINPDKRLNSYPGSPKIAEYFLRNQDKLKLFELHPNEYKILNSHFTNHRRKKTEIFMQDGFKGINACLPPVAKRGIVLIDPPYENKQDYHKVVDTLQNALKRFATGCYIIWYPLLKNGHSVQMIKELNPKNWLNATLTVHQPFIEDYGMHGSGLLIINPPWTLPSALQESLPIIARHLRPDIKAEAHLSYEID